YSNSSPRAIERVMRMAPGRVEAIEADLRDTPRVAAALAGRDVTSVVHLASLKAVGESVADPGRYRDNNVGGTRSLLEALAGTPARNFVFSSSATVYGLSGDDPIAETTPTSPRNPYGENKLEIEALLADLARRDASWRIANLRYFNPVGAHES